MPARGPRPQHLIAAAACWLLCACAAPVAYPRSAELLDGGRTRLRLSSYAVGLSDDEAEAEIDGQSGTYSDLSVADKDLTFAGLEWVLGPALSVEGGFDLSLDVCELGALGGLMRVGVELRCGVLQERWGAPFSLAASAAALYAFDLSGTNDHEGFRFGLDASVPSDRWAPLFGAYVDYGMRERTVFDSDLPASDSGIGTQEGSIEAVRDEWRLAVPLGITRQGEKGGAAIAIIPEYTLFARNHKPPYLRTGDTTGTVTSFEQRWAVFLAGTLWVLP